MLEPDSPTPARSSRRRAATALAYAAFLLALVEVGAWSCLALTGRATGFDEQLAAVLGDADALDLGDPVTRRGEALTKREGLHPYLGFMPRSAGGGLPPEVHMIWQPRLYKPGSPLFSTDPDELIVGIAGGSVAGQFSRLGGALELAKLLEQSERFRGRSVRFVVAAYGGVKQPQQLMAVNYLLALGGRLDLLINLDGFNEIALHEMDNQPQGVSPVYPRSWLHRVAGMELLPLVGQQQVLQDERSRLARDVEASALNRSGLRRLIWARQDQALGRKLEALGEELRTFQSSASPDLVTVGPRLGAPDGPGRLEQLVGIWQQSSLQLHQVCAANGIEYYHFLQPNQYVAGSKTLSEEELEEAYLRVRATASTLPPATPDCRTRGRPWRARACASTT